MEARLHAENKRSVYTRLRQLCAASDAELGASMRALYVDDAVCSVAHPVNVLVGCEQIGSGWFRPLRAAVPDVERRDDIVLAGEFAGTELVGLLGHYQGTFTAPLFGIPPTNGVVQIRYGEVHELRNGRSTRSWVLVDFLDLMRQARAWPLPPSLGTEGAWPGPATQTGLALDAVDPMRGAESLKIVKAMHGALLSFDGKNLETMDHARYWAPNFMWYGPSGIGTTRGLRGFQAHHQIPFLRALPDRAGGDNMYFGDGDYTMNCGWPGMSATHTGGDWLGLAPTGRRFTIRVMDFYRIDNGLLAQNWVPIDLVDILQQLGVDAFARMRHLTGNPRLALR
jgi:predicted ester cyclase